MKNIRIKVCGITRPEDALYAYHAGASAIGMIFYPPSPRNISLEKGHEIVSALNPLCNTVAVTVDMQAQQIGELIDRVGVNTMQFHGEESPQFCDQFALPYFKAIRIRPTLNLQAEIDRYPNARGILLDTYVSGVVGGTGKTFDWKQLSQISDSRIIVAGGLKPDTIRTAVAQSQAEAFDVASGVESSPGIKDHQKIAALFSALGY